MSIGTKIIDYMKAQGYRIRALNIVGVGASTLTLA